MSSTTSAVSTPVGDYFPIDTGFGSTDAELGDESMVNFDTDTFWYAGEAWDRIGVDSNGYVVVGGGTSADNNCCSLPDSLPDAARPNNEVAPFWTDLNLNSATTDGAGKAWVNELCDGISGPCWLIVDYQGAQNYGEPGNVHTFELWFQLDDGSGAASEQVTITYGTSTSGGTAGNGTLWGAENADGTSGQQFDTQPADNTDWAVVTGDPTPGGSATVTYKAGAKSAGSYKSTATMTSNKTKGTTTAVQNLTVTP